MIIAFSRRRVLTTAAASSLSWSCRRDLPEVPQGTPCGGGLIGGRRLGTLPFVVEDARTLEALTGSGLDARYYIDLERLEPGMLLQGSDNFYLRTGASSSRPDPAAWEIALTGLVEEERAVHIDALLAQVRPIGTLHFECSGNAEAGHFGLMSAGDFAGVPMSWLLSQVSPSEGASLVEVAGYDSYPPSTFSDPGAAWIFHPEDLENAWLVTHQDGSPLAPDHGHPVRILVPGWYGCCNIKWVQRVSWLPEGAPATTQMLEFASRTHQDGAPALAWDYAPAEIQTAATPSRVERWEVDGEVILRVIGVVWGGKAEPSAIHLWMDGEDLGPVERCEREHIGTWGLWQATLPKGSSGLVRLRCAAEGVPARRLDDAFYARTVDLDA